MENLLNQLGNIFNIIATQLGCSVEFVKANFETYLLEFGKYKLIENIPNNLFMGIGIALVLGIIIIIAWILFVDSTTTTEEERKFNKIMITTGTVACTISFLTPMAIEIIKFLVSPTMYSINEAMKMLK